MALGTPVVGANVGALAELVTDGTNGLKVAPNDPDSLGGLPLGKHPCAGLAIGALRNALADTSA